MQPWGVLNEGERHVLMGVSGTGKTTLVKRLTAEAFRCLWFDPEGEYAAPGRLVVKVAELERWPGLLVDPHARIVVEPTDDDPEAMAEDVGALCSLLLHFKRLPMVVVFEELGDYGRLPAAEKGLSRLWKKGRKRGLVPLACSQVATDIPLHVRKQATDAWVTSQDHAGEIAEVERIYGPQMAERARSWQRWQPPAHWRRGEGMVST
jgi:hypothetical protein